MDAYNTAPDGGQKARARKGRSSVVVELEKNKKEELIQTSDNNYFFATAACEAILLGGFIAMNYCFRFDPTARDNSSLADYSKLTLGITDLIPARPYYNYSESLDDNQKSGFTFGISFTMMEYAFFVPVFVVPFLLIVLVETPAHFFPRKQRKNVTSMGLTFHPAVRRMFRFYYTFLLFGCVAGLFTSFIKLLVPIARPHFLAVCMTAPTTNNMLLSVADCPNPDKSEVYEALRSFPSYHATIASYSGVFICLYLFYTMRIRGTYSLSVLLSVPFVIMALIGGLHRWVTYHSSPEDLAWGAFIGLVLAFYAVYGTLHKFQERAWKIVPAAEPSKPKSVEEVKQQADGTDGSPAAYDNPAFGRQTPLSKTNQVTQYGQAGMQQAQQQPAPQPKQSIPPSSPVQGPSAVRPSSQSVVIPRLKDYREMPVGRPTQAFNSSFVLDNNYRGQPGAGGPQGGEGYRGPGGAPANRDYNTPRQRYSVPAPPRPPSNPRPASAYPGERPYNRYEGTAYF